MSDTTFQTYYEKSDMDGDILRVSNDVWHESDQILVEVRSHETEISNMVLLEREDVETLIRALERWKQVAPPEPTPVVGSVKVEVKPVFDIDDIAFDLQNVLDNLRLRVVVDA